MMEEKDTLIRELVESRKDIRSVVDAVDLQRELYPEWTKKQFLAHLTGWDEATTASLRAHAGGKEPGTPAYRGIDFYNAQSVATRMTLEYRHVVSEWDVAREDLKAAIRDLPEEKFEEVLIYPWGQSGSVMKLVGIMIDHEHEHAEELRERLGLVTGAHAPPTSPEATPPSLESGEMPPLSPSSPADQPTSN